MYLRFVKLLVIVCYGEMMCRVSNVGELVSMTQSVFVNFELSNVIEIVPNMPMFSSDWIIMIVGVLVVFFVSVCAEKKIDLKENLKLYLFGNAGGFYIQLSLS